MKPLLKWPGGKSREIARFYGMIPPFARYIEPFFGGGALYFHLMPERAAINDVSRDLMAFYRMVQQPTAEFEALLRAYAAGFDGVVALAGQHRSDLLCLLTRLSEDPDIARSETAALLNSWRGRLSELLSPLCLDLDAFLQALERALWDKLRRTAHNHSKKPFSRTDLEENLITGLAGGYYLFFRDLYNQYAAGLGDPSPAQRAANFYFVREMCYGAMFRYNAKGEFNIPYGGMSYNHKNLTAKVDALFQPELQALLSRTSLSCMDFEAFLAAVQPTEQDFLFLDPPYDTEFSDYEGAAFTKLDQARLAVALSRTPAKFLLIIKNTDFIQGLYGQGFHVWKFDKQYAYNVRSRNDRSAEHLIVTNYSLPL